MYISTCNTGKARRCPETSQALQWDGKGAGEGVKIRASATEQRHTNCTGNLREAVKYRSYCKGLYTITEYASGRLPIQNRDFRRSLNSSRNASNSAIIPRVSAAIEVPI